MSPFTYYGFGLFTMLLVALDIWQTRGGKISVKKAAIWSAIWVAIAFAFAISIYYFWTFYSPNSDYTAKQATTAFLTGYLLEKSLSVDNLFVFTIIFHQYMVPDHLRPRALLWGVIGALVLRSVMIVIGAQILTNFHWVMYIFAAFLVWTGIQLFKPEKEDHGISPLPERWLRRVARVSDGYEGHKLVIKQDGLLWLTPMAIVIAVIAMMDVVFALDSIPAIFAVTREPFLVLAANVFALLGLRSLFFVLQGMIDKFVYLRTALAFIMVFIGIKMSLVETAWAIPTWISLSVLLFVMSVAVVASMLKNNAPEKLKAK
ncbi:TerC/Alx family metal homeostasis membrane protein [Vibrio tapetis subsp. quintayensis]|uniref:TerC/Alx family metal homeostasis membrane protein n=1 Tax=Vibrio tapetis TaxID=52443 RepID=UPI0025B57054|nr:TerC/Alx family metal homeostasis membrane protein [Vibrio tapetis]MDN3678748.1 TerC/Alx family metal homeostasis membrane protein [Vibrio tapetis subsp. quintayensis]